MGEEQAGPSTALRAGGASKTEKAEHPTMPIRFVDKQEFPDLEDASWQESFS